MANLVERGLPSAGIYAGPAAWLIDTQANYALVPWVCAHQVRLVPVVALVMLLVSLSGGFLSWRAWSAAGSAPEAHPSAGGRPHRFVAAVGIAAALLFGLVIILQGTAGLVFHGCER
ncbi:hypothetical protein [Microvirga massiliensis]|uniref:hypothetical protein n=1 Tax=Microvirga massiliensis TaxID=1033741 RepID=UPI00062B6DE3|nr:hypothetical protein [Microvirga massiliensis]